MSFNRLAMRNINDRREAAATRIQRLQRHRQQQRQQREQQERREDNSDAAAVPGAEISPESHEGEAEQTMRRSIDTLRTSISDIRDELIQSSGSEPMVRLRRSVQGSESNVVSVEQGSESQASNLDIEHDTAPNRVLFLAVYSFISKLHKEPFWPVSVGARSQRDCRGKQ